jgi:hypothetical protein
MRERNIQSEILLAIGARPDCTLFRNNTGMAWTGEVVRRTPNTITLQNPRPLHAGLCKGSSDLIGWRRLVITPEMVGLTVAQFLALEVKTDRGRATEEQRNFLRVVAESGGAGAVVRSVAEAVACVDGFNFCE